MIYGIGIDIVDHEKIIRLLTNHHQRLSEVFFSPIELEIVLSSCRSDPPGLDPPSVEYVAQLFALKEAVIKTLRMSRFVNFEWKDIEIVNREPVDIRLRNNLFHFAKKENITQFTASTSSMLDLTIATVIGEMP